MWRRTEGAREREKEGDKGGGGGEKRGREVEEQQQQQQRENGFATRNHFARPLHARRLSGLSKRRGRLRRNGAERAGAGAQSGGKATKKIEHARCRRADDDRSMASLFLSLSLYFLTLHLASGPAPVARPLSLTASAERWAEERRSAAREAAKRRRVMI